MTKPALHNISLNCHGLARSHPRVSFNNTRIQRLAVDLVADPNLLSFPMPRLWLTHFLLADRAHALLKKDTWQIGMAHNELRGTMITHSPTLTAPYDCKTSLSKQTQTGLAGGS